MALKGIISFLAIVCCTCSTSASQNEVDEGIQKATQANAYFAHRLYNQLRQDSQNLVFSPLSMFVALSMVYTGSCGNTSQELESSLGLSAANLSEQQLLQAYRNISRSITEVGDGYQFDLANAQFVQDSFPILDEYTRKIVEHFSAVSGTVDFTESQETLNVINGWVRNATRGKINTILSEIDPTTVMVLLNAIYFKGKWLNTFDEEYTNERRFVNENGEEKMVRMMSEDLEAKYSPSLSIGASVLELPYKRNTFSMIFVLPNEGKTLTDLESSLTAETLLQVTDQCYVENLKVVIPVMKLESEIEMNSHLQEVGIRQLLSNHACLDRISSTPLTVSQVMHKATLELTEEGCEASAATSVQFSARSLVHHQPSFVANRPFMFLVRHNPTNTITFMGRVADV